MGERTNQCIVGGVVLAAVIVVAILLAIRSSGKPVCKLQADRPKINTTKTKAIVSQENNALLKFAGYVKYKLDPKSKDKNAFLDLSETRSVILKGGNSVIIKADCATITIKLNLDYTWNQIEISSVTMELVKPAGEHYTCGMFFDAVYPKGKHYSCKIQKSYACWIDTETTHKNNVIDQNSTIATLIVEDLEFEINGSANKVKEGQFSTQADECLKYQ